MRVVEAFRAAFGADPADRLARARPGQPDRRAHRLQRRLRAAVRGPVGRHGGGQPARGPDDPPAVAPGALPEPVDLATRDEAQGWTRYAVGVSGRARRPGARRRHRPRRRRAPGRRAQLQRRPGGVRRLRPQRAARPRPDPHGGRAAQPAGRERLRRHAVRHHGPGRLGALRGGPRAVPRLPHARLPQHPARPGRARSAHPDHRHRGCTTSTPAASTPSAAPECESAARTWASTRCATSPTWRGARQLQGDERKRVSTW